MTDFVSLIARHGYLIIGLVVFAEAIGLPMPAAIALVGGGAAVASHVLSLPYTLLVALSAMLVGDSLLFVLGRYTGWAFLGVLCKLSLNPETCILRSAESFYKRGKKTLLIAKFIPGVNTMATPLAGSMKMRYQQFIWLDLAGAALYVLAYGTLGYIFRDFVAGMVRGFQMAGHVVESVVLIGVLIYIGYRIRTYWKYRIYRVVPRVQVEELARRLQEEDPAKILVVDVRSHGYYDSGAARIKGSIRVEPNNISKEIETVPKDKDIYVYCT